MIKSVVETGVLFYTQIGLFIMMCQIILTLIVAYYGVDSLICVFSGYSSIRCV